MISTLTYLLLVVLNSWLWMQGIHELGHVLAAVWCHGTVTEIVWWPTEISRTDVDPNPCPRFVCWAGPLTGGLAPLLIWQLVRVCGRRVSFLQFFAGFCLIANGAYLAFGTLDHTGDAGTLLAQGTPVWLLWLLGIAALLGGLNIWHRLGRLTDLWQPFMTARGLIPQTLLLLLALICMTVLKRS